LGIDGLAGDHAEDAATVAVLETLLAHAPQARERRDLALQTALRGSRSRTRPSAIAASTFSRAGLPSSRDSVAVESHHLASYTLDNLDQRT
jgi:hypothetical protein